MGERLTIVVPTKNRCAAVKGLLDSIKKLRGLGATVSEVIVGDNDSSDQTWDILQGEAKGYPIPLRLVKITKPGKSAAVNEAARIATGEILAFLDDDVVIEEGWLQGVQQFFHHNGHAVGQGIIQIPPEESKDSTLQKLIERYRTIPKLEYDGFDERHSLNGANMAIRREVFDRLNGFDERLGPGASGTSEDVDLAQRARRAGIKIGCMKEAIVYHRVDRSRLTDTYFKNIHRRQGQSRLLFKNRCLGHIVWDLFRSTLQYGFNSLFGNERSKYRSMGRIHHYLGMLEAKRNGRSKDTRSPVHLRVRKGHRGFF
jgi:GT2 family glycosyltransferase